MILQVEHPVEKKNYQEAKSQFHNKPHLLTYQSVVVFLRLCLQNPVHGISAWLEQKVVNLHVGQNLVDSRNL